MKLFILHILITLIFIRNSFGHGGGGEAGANVGKEKGVIAISEKEGMTIAPEAIKRLEIKTQALSGNAPWIVSKEALVFSKEDISIYRELNGKYKAILIESTKKSDGTYQINSWQLKPQDNIVIQGAGLLRISELDASPGKDEHDESKHNAGVEDKHSDHKEGDHHD
jgi:hypothetical protein